MIDASAGDISVAGKGTPVIYINGHQMRDYNDLELLTSKDLDSLEIITNPSSKYGSEVSSVILIKTKKRMNGLYASVAAKISLSEKMSESTNIRLGYSMGNGLYVFSDFSIDESCFNQKCHYSETISRLDTVRVGNSDTYMTCSNRTRSLTADGGLIYDFGKHSVGAKPFLVLIRKQLPYFDRPTSGRGNILDKQLTVTKTPTLSELIPSVSLAKVNQPKGRYGLYPQRQHFNQQCR